MKVSDNVVLRSASDTDLEVLVGFQMAMAAESEDKGLNKSTLRDGIEFALSSEDIALYIVAEISGEPVGTLMLTWEWSDWRNGRFWWIQSVYVVPEHRRLGVYSAMHRHVLSLASKDPKVAGVRLYVEKDNDGAQATYKQLGMDETDYRLFETDFSKN